MQNPTYSSTFFIYFTFILLFYDNHILRLYLYGSFTYDSTLVKQSYTELLLYLTESGKSPAEQLFGVELRSEADDFIRLTFENMEPSRLFYSSYLI